MGNQQSDIIPINNICPISLDKINDGIVLNCRHYYSEFHIQRYCLDYIIKNKNITCPICKKKINKKKLKHIIKNWIVVQNVYDNWSQENIIYLFKIYKKYNNYKIINNKDKTIIIIPLFKKNNMIQSCLIKSSILDRLEIIDHKIFTTNLYKKKKTIYDEEINEIKLCLRSKCINPLALEIYYKMINKVLLKNNLNYLNIDKNYIYFFIDNQSNITTYDKIIGTMEKFFFYKINQCKILFSPYIIYDNNNTFLINKIYSIIYH